MEQSLVLHQMLQRGATTVGETQRSEITFLSAEPTQECINPESLMGNTPSSCLSTTALVVVSNSTATASPFHFVSVCLDLLPPNIHLHPNHTLIDGTAIHAASASCHSSRLGVILRIHITCVIIFTKYTAKCGGFICPLDAFIESFIFRI